MKTKTGETNSNATNAVCSCLYNNVHAIILIYNVHKSYTKLHLHGKVAHVITQVSKYYYSYYA